MVLAALRGATLDELVALGIRGRSRTPPDPRARPLAVRVTHATAAWAADYRLTEAHAEIRRRAALGACRSEIAKARGCSDLTIKSHIATMLRRTGDHSLEEALLRLLREVATEGTREHEAALRRRAATAKALRAIKSVWRL